MNILGELDVEVVRVTVTELRENTFHASITVAQNGTEVEIDSRSSDAIAIAVRAQAPIFAADDVIEESAIEMEGDEVNEEEIVDEFKRFLDKVSAEDFAEAEVEADDRPTPTTSRRPRTTESAVELALRQREQIRIERAQPLVAQRPGVRLGQMIEEPLLSLRVDEGETVLDLVALQPRNQVEAPVDRRDDLVVEAVICARKSATTGSEPCSSIATA